MMSFREGKVVQLANFNRFLRLQKCQSLSVIATPTVGLKCWNTSSRLVKPAKLLRLNWFFICQLGSKHGFVLLYLIDRFIDISR